MGSDPIRTYHKFGFQPAITTTRLDIWDVATAYPWPSANAETTIVSTDAADAAAGTGIATVEVEGVTINTNGDYVHVTETATLTGVSAVTLTNDFFRVFRMRGLTAGSAGSGTSVAAGNIQVKHGATVIAQITAGYSQTNMALFTVPDRYGGLEIRRAELIKWSFTVGKGKDGTGSLWVRQHGEIFNQKDIRTAFERGFVYDYTESTPLILAPKTDIVIRGISDVASTAFSANMLIRLEA